MKKEEEERLRFSIRFLVNGLMAEIVRDGGSLLFPAISSPHVSFISRCRPESCGSPRTEVGPQLIIRLQQQLRGRRKTAEKLLLKQEAAPVTAKPWLRLRLRRTKIGPAF